MSKKFVILDSSEVSSVNFDEVMEYSADMLRYSLDGTQTFVKYTGNKPRFLYGKPTHTLTEMHTILEGPEWTDPNID